MEIHLKLLKHVKPDLCLINKNPELGEAEACLKGIGKMLFLIEAKKVETQYKRGNPEENNYFKNRKKPFGGSALIKEIKQNFN